MKKRKRDIFERSIVIFTWTLGLIFIYWALLKLTNHSPTLDQVLLVIMGAFLGLTGHQQYKFGRIDEYMERNKEDVKELKVQLHDFKNKVSEDLQFIKSKLS